MSKKLLICAVFMTATTVGVHAAEVILNEYNAVRASRWLDCDGMNCCCELFDVPPVCQGGDNPGATCAADDDCLGHYECSPDGGLTFSGDACAQANGDVDCAALDPNWTCEPHTADGVCLCDPPCKQDVFFGRVEGNGGNWIELVVTGNHTDMRGWQLNWTEDPSDAGTLTLTDDPLWADLRAGTIITFTELSSAVGGLDTDSSYDPGADDWWININTLSFDGTPQTKYVTTVTNVAGDGPGAFSVGNDNWQLTILDADSSVVFGPCGEGIRFVCNGGPLADEPCTDTSNCAGAPCEVIGVSGWEIFKLQEDPSADIDPVNSNYKDGTSSTFGHPNVWRGGDRNQDFTCVRCDDGVFCNGVEACAPDGTCQPGDEPCQDQTHCVEDTRTCLACISAVECDDGDPCTEDVCDGGTCRSTAIPECGDNVTPPDSDDDGIADTLDECPDTPSQETVNDVGCSCTQLDLDEDGVDDCTDECPETSHAETVDDTGCSRSQLDDDRDGVTNDADLCGDTPEDEEADETGCSPSQVTVEPTPQPMPTPSPQPTPAPQPVPDDQDGDGVADADDACPDVFGAGVDGCPVEDDTNQCGASAASCGAMGGMSLWMISAALGRMKYERRHKR